MAQGRYRYRARSRTLTNLLLAIGALVLGLAAQDFFWRFLSAPAPTDGLVALAAATLLFVLAFLRSASGSGVLPSLALGSDDVERNQEREARKPGLAAWRSTWRPVWRFGWASVFLVLAGGAIVTSLSLFRDEIRPQLRWLLYLAAPVLFMAAVYVLGPGVLLPQHSSAFGPRQLSLRRAFDRWRDPRLRRHAIALIGILVIGAWFRLYLFTELPYGLWYDEADNGLWARQILANSDFRPIYVESTNLPAHFLYLIALSFRLLGDSMHSIRAVSVVFGMLTIVAAYCCGRELGARASATRGNAHLGLTLALLLAVSRWDVNWSRIGMHGVTVPFFELWVVAALLRGLRTRRLVAFGWAGVALGFGLCFYSPFRAFPVVLAGFLMAYGLRWMIGRFPPPGGGSGLGSDSGLGRDLRHRVAHMVSVWGIPALLFFTGALIAVAPVAQYALREPDVFWDRAKRVLILEDPEAKEDPVHALLDSASKHLLMFHYRGDPNGRHNLPGAPMLDRLTGVLMVFGVAMCLCRLWDPRAVLLLLWMLVPLGGGILSTWFEAPQSLRSIGSLPAVYALACLPMVWFAGEWRCVFTVRRDEQARRDGGADWSDGRPGQWRSVNARLAVLAVVVLGAIALENGFFYFYLWGRDFASWAAFSAAETGLARDVSRYRGEYDLRFDPLVTAHLATRYLVPDYEVYHAFDPGTVFPLRGTSKNGVVLFIAPDTHPVRRQAEELYSWATCGGPSPLTMEHPGGERPCPQVETFAHPYSGHVVLFKYLFSREAIAGVQGLDGRFAPLVDAESGAGSVAIAAIEHRVDHEIDGRLAVDWPDGRATVYPFEAIWTGGLLAPEYGTYTLYVELPGPFVLELDGREVLSGEGSASRRVVMAQGVHALYLDGRVSRPGAVRLMWQTPADAPGTSGEALRTVPGDALYRAFWPVRGLLGRFYANGEWAGEPVMARLDRQVAYYFHFLPLPRPYTVEWTGRLAAPVEGTYRLSVKAISSASLYVDGQQVIDSTSPGQIGAGEIYLAAGLHDIRVRYLDDQSHSQIYLYWQLPGADLELIPSDALFPPSEGAWWPAQ